MPNNDWFVTRPGRGVGRSAPTTLGYTTARADAPQKHTPIQAQAENATVSGGAFNLANDLYTSISGGCDNLAAASGKALTLPKGLTCQSSGAQYASITGGDLNTASSLDASVSGGGGNVASGPEASVSAGLQNTAGGEYSSVSGGNAGKATLIASSVSGGEANHAGGLNATVSNRPKVRTPRSSAAPGSLSPRSTLDHRNKRAGGLAPRPDGWPGRQRRGQPVEGDLCEEAWAATRRAPITNTQSAGEWIPSEVDGNVCSMPGSSPITRGDALPADYQQFPADVKARLDLLIPYVLTTSN